jgi:hypothetical protein
MEKINRICETKENWDPDCEEFKGSKALHKMTENRTVSRKNEQRLYRKPVRAKLSFSIRNFSSKLEFQIQAWKKK